MFPTLQFKQERHNLYLFEIRIQATYIEISQVSQHPFSAGDAAASIFL